MNGNDKRKILEDPNKRTDEVVNAPAFMFRMLLNKLSIGTREYDAHMKTYLDRVSTSKDPITLASDRGNLNKALLADKISWKTFMKGIEMLGALQVKFTTEVMLGDNRIVKVETDPIPIRKPTVSLLVARTLNLEEHPVDEEEDVI